MKVTKYRLYGLISVFLELGADASSITEAMRIALLQGDDLALSLLLGGLTRVYPHVQMDVRRGLDDLIALAEKMHSTQLTARLRSVLVKREPGDVQLPVFNDYAPFAWQMLSYANTTCDTETASGGYQPALLAQTYSAVDETVTAGGPGVAVPVCAVDSVDIRSLSAAQFHRDYVLLNRPVVLTGGDFAASLAGAVWGLDALLSVHGAVRDVSSAIPYATLFGHTEVD